MFGKFFETLSVKKEKIPGPRAIQFENGVKLEISSPGASKELQMQFFQAGREAFDLKGLAPAGTRVFPDPAGKWQAVRGTKEIFVGKFDAEDCVLSFLHEAGHLHDDVSGDLVQSAKMRNAGADAGDQEKKFPPERLQAMKEERALVLLEERTAWAFALRQARQLERQLGISILKKIGNAAEVAKYVNGFLESYEQVYLDDLQDLNIFSQAEMEKMFRQLEQPEK